MFVGTGHVWRTKTHGLGTMTVADAPAALQRVDRGLHAVTCGDWVALGPAG